MSEAMQIPSNFLADRTQIRRATAAVESASDLARRGAGGPARVGATGNGGSGNEKLQEVAQDFESLFLKQMLDTMRSTLNKENRLVDTGMAGEYFQDMLYDEYSKIMSKRGTFGIAEMIVEQLGRSEA